MKKRLFFYLVVFCIMLINLVFADIPCSPECHIEGTIIDVNFTEMTYSPCALENCSGKVPDVMCCPFDVMPTQSAGYFLKIKINEENAIKEPCLESHNCRGLFKEGTEQIIFISKEKVKERDLLIKFQRINGSVWDMWSGREFISYNLGEKVECLNNSDCYPKDFIPPTCGGLFFQCSSGRCYEGSSQCPPSNNEENKSTYIFGIIILAVLLILVIYFLIKKISR